MVPHTWATIEMTRIAARKGEVIVNRLQRQNGHYHVHTVAEVYTYILK